jgi:hypothetical protein
MILPAVGLISLFMVLLIGPEADGLYDSKPYNATKCSLRTFSTLDQNYPRAEWHDFSLVSKLILYQFDANDNSQTLCGLFHITTKPYWVLAFMAIFNLGSGSCSKFKQHIAYRQFSP